MLYKKQITNVDYGITTLENIFINDFMPMANGTFVKVYLMGYKFACDSTSEIKMTQATLARDLSLTLEDVHNAWTFWEQKGIIKKIMSEDGSDYGIEFLSLRQLYVENNFQPKKSEPKPTRRESSYINSPGKLVEAYKVPAIKQMFHDIDYIIRRQLPPHECQDILNIIFDYKMEPDIIIAAFDYSYNKMNKRNTNYVKGVLRNWYDSGINSLDKLEELSKQPQICILKFKKFTRYWVMEASQYQLEIKK